MGKYYVDMDDLANEVLIDAGDPKRQARLDKNQQTQISNLTRHVRVLWNHIERLERALALSNKAGPAQTVVKLEAMNNIDLRCGTALLQLKRDGSIVLSGKDIRIVGAGDILAKASGNITLKGAKITQT